MHLKKLAILCLCFILVLPMNVYASTDGNQINSEGVSNSDTPVSTGTILLQKESNQKTSNSSEYSTNAIDWDLVVYATFNGWDISRQDWYNPFDDNVDEWAKFKVGTKLTSEDGISVKMNTRADINKNGHYWGGCPSTTLYGDEVFSYRTDDYPNHGDDYDVTSFHRVWDDNGVKVLDKTEEESHTF